MKKVCVMTGATSGFGVCWIKTLVETGNYKCYILARTKDKFNALSSVVPLKYLEFVECDLSSLKSISDASNRIMQKVDKIDLLINNAGVFPQKYELSTDKVELTYAVNYLAPYILTKKLIGRMNNNSRIINTSSFQHLNVKETDFKPMDADCFNPMSAYQESKLFLTMLTSLMQSEYKHVSINCYDPGIVNTHMTLEAINSNRFHKLLFPLIKPFIRTREKGAETGIFLSLDCSVSQIRGQYFKDKRQVSINPMANNKKNCDKLKSLTDSMLINL